MNAKVESLKDKFFEDFKIGDFATLTHVFTREDVDAYKNILGDDNPLHFDEEFAKEKGFKGCLVQGMLTAGLAVTLAGTKLPGPGAILAHSSFEWERPVCVGDEVIMKVTVAELHGQRRLGRVVLMVEGFVGVAIVIVGTITLCVSYKNGVPKATA